MTAKKAEPARAPAPESLIAGNLRGLLADVLLFASTDSCRPVINAVQVERTKDRLYARATDSYTLAEEWVEVEPGTPWTAVWPYPELKILQQILNLDPKGNVVVTPGEHETTFTCWRVDLTIGHVERAGDYPDVAGLFKKSWPKGDSGASTAFNPELMSRLGRLKFCRAERGEPAIFTFGPTPHAPAGFTIGDRFRGLIMPVRTSSS